MRIGLCVWERDFNGGLDYFQIAVARLNTLSYMPAEFGDSSYPGLGTAAGVKSGGYVEKMGFSLSDIPKVPYQQ